MYYITVSNGLLTPEHKKKMGSAIWEFMWCLDKMTKIDSKGRGVVLGGKPIKLAEIGMGHDNTTCRNMQKLEEEGYITTTRTPFGMVIYINKPKKVFQKGSKSPTNNGESLKPVNHQKWESPTGNGESPTNNGDYKEDNTDDNTDDNTKGETSSPEIPLLIKSFESLNPASKKFYGQPVQRKACKELIENYGFDRVKTVIEKTLSKTNTLQFFPVITTPLQLMDKWTALESAIRKHQKVEIKNKSNVAF